VFGITRSRHGLRGRQLHILLLLCVTSEDEERNISNYSCNDIIAGVGGLRFVGQKIRGIYTGNFVAVENNIVQANIVLCSANVAHTS